MRPDQERVRNLLIDTVTLLCKNSVQFKDMLHVEGLLGVSVDKKDVFFVHISKEFANSPSEGATVTHDTTDSQDEDSRLADESIDVRDGQHRQKLSDKAHHQDEQQARIKTEILEEECLIVEDPSVKLEGIVSPAQLIAGQRRSMKRTSHSSLMAGGSGSGLHGGDNYDEDISVPYSGEGADNSHYSHMGEPPSKRKASDGHHHTDDGYNVTAHGEEDPGGTPWPSIASVPGFDPTQQSFQQDSDNSQMSITDGTQPGCSSWSTPGRGPSDSMSRGLPPLQPSPRRVHPAPITAQTPGDETGYVRMGGAGDGYRCNVCGLVCPWLSSIKTHIMTHTGEKPYQCPHCPYGSNYRRNTMRHVANRHAAVGSQRRGNSRWDNTQLQGRDGWHGPDGQDDPSWDGPPPFIEMG